MPAHPPPSSAVGPPRRIDGRVNSDSGVRLSGGSGGRVLVASLGIITCPHFPSPSGIVRCIANARRDGLEASRIGGPLPARWAW